MIASVPKRADGSHALPATAFGCHHQSETASPAKNGLEKISCRACGKLLFYRVATSSRPTAKPSDEPPPDAMRLSSGPAPAPATPDTPAPEQEPARPRKRFDLTPRQRRMKVAIGTPGNLGGKKRPTIRKSPANDEAERQKFVREYGDLGAACFDEGLTFTETRERYWQQPEVRRRFEKLRCQLGSDHLARMTIATERRELAKV